MALWLLRIFHLKMLMNDGQMYDDGCLGYTILKPNNEPSERGELCK